jgi:hypothetical protein
MASSVDCVAPFGRRIDGEPGEPESRESLAKMLQNISEQHR